MNLLDSCTTERNDLKSTLKNNTKSKNGSRLKVLSYKGDDGSESTTTMLFDTVKNTICSPVNYECNDKVYCVATDSIQTTKEFDKHVLCSNIYDKFDSVIIDSFGYNNVKDLNKFSVYSGKTFYFYTDPNCSDRYRYNGIFVEDKECHFNKQDILRLPVSHTEENKNICIDGSSTYVESEVYRYEYYKPKVSSFSTIYRYFKETEECRVITENAILLSSLPDISLEQAKVNRNIYCSDYCSNLESELDDYVEMKLEPM